MVQELIDYCQHDLSMWRLLYNHKEFRGQKVYVALMVVSLLAVVVSAVLVSWGSLNAVWLVLAVVFAMVIIACLNIHNSKEVIRIYASEANSKLNWKQNLYHISLNKLGGELENKNIKGTDQIQLVVDRLYKEAENRKFSGLFVGGAFAALAVPLWSVFLQRWFRMATTPSSLAITFLRAMAIILAACFVYFVFSCAAKEILNTKSVRIRRVAEMIDEILLEKLAEEQKKKKAKEGSSRRSVSKKKQA